MAVAREKNLLASRNAFKRGISVTSSKFTSLLNTQTSKLLEQ